MARLNEMNTDHKFLPELVVVGLFGGGDAGGSLTAQSRIDVHSPMKRFRLSAIIYENIQITAIFKH